MIFIYDILTYSTITVAILAQVQTFVSTSTTLGFHPI